MALIECHLCGKRLDSSVEDIKELPILHKYIVWAALGTKTELVCTRCYEEYTL